MFPIFSSEICLENNSPSNRENKRRKCDSIPDDSSVCGKFLKIGNPIDFPILDADRIEEEESFRNLLGCDVKRIRNSIPRETGIGAYGHALCHLSREKENVMGKAKLSKILLQERTKIIGTYYEVARNHKLSHYTLELACEIFDRVVVSKGNNWTEAAWILMAVASFRLALKFEEQPETVWDFPNLWAAFGMFQNVKVEKSVQKLQETEYEILRILDNDLGFPLASQFFVRYLDVGEWPEDNSKKYAELGLYLVALSNFSEGCIPDCSPSMLAAASLALSIKIVNAFDPDRTYEFFPERLSAYSGMTLQQIQPAIKGLSSLLKTQPSEVIQQN
eukprot:GHVP01069321.1.p1 GENE.GHVP01069321.1~~GHVP01069321.1.p1  ORF type:complete len:333 (-),score=50.82 GHVP01069321.1:221-1219(-)